LNPRAANIWPFVFERSKRGSLRRAMIFLLIIAALILYVGGKVKIVRLGYQIEALERKRKTWSVQMHRSGSKPPVLLRRRVSKRSQ